MSKPWVLETGNNGYRIKHDKMLLFKNLDYLEALAVVRLLDALEASMSINDIVTLVKGEDNVR